MSFVVDDPAKHLKVEDFVSTNGLEKLRNLVLKPFRTVSITNSDIVKVASPQPLSIPIDILGSLRRFS